MKRYRKNRYQPLGKRKVLAYKAIRPKKYKMRYFVLISALFLSSTCLAIDTLDELAAAKPEELANIDIALMNLLCAQGLPGSENLDIQESLRQLDRLALFVAEQTEQFFYMYQSKPAQFRYHEGYYRMQMMITVLMQDFGVQYNPMRTNDEDGMTFFADSKDLFLSGFTARSERMGTCASMPGLYVAIGRRLGYPLELVHAKAHVFARWQGKGGTSFNIEATNSGMSSHPDSYYEKWSLPLSEAELESGFYLKNLPPKQVLAGFLSSRGICFEVNGRLSEAKTCYEQAAQLVPENEAYTKMIVNIKKRISYLINQP